MAWRILRPTRLRRWLPAILVSCLLLPFLNGLVVGFGSVWLQFFGSQADREDYLISFGGYAAAVLVLLIGLVSMLRLGTAEWAGALMVVLAVVLAILAFGSLTKGLGMEPEPQPYGRWRDGAGGVRLLPWAWPPLVLGALALVGRGPTRPTTQL